MSNTEFNQKMYFIFSVLLSIISKLEYARLFLQEKSTD